MPQITPVTAAGSGPSAGAGPIKASPTTPTQSQSDTWMKLLLAQARNPNPFGDNDPGQTVTQMAQFQMVSELNEVGKLLKGQAASNQVQTASALLGKSVTYLDADGAEKTGVATGLRVTSDGAKLSVGTDEVAISQLRTVATAAAAPSPTAPSPSGAPTPSTSPVPTT